MTVRRPVPPAKLGPPWWDVTFVPLRDGDKLLGVLGTIAAGRPAGSTAGGKGLSEALVALRQRAVERAPLDRSSTANRAAGPPAPGPGRAGGQDVRPGLADRRARDREGDAGPGHPLPRARRGRLAFAGIDCAGLQPYLIRSLLFGHNGLAETGRVGTIYLKDPEALAADLQAELIEWGELLADECRVVVGAGRTGTGLSPEFRAAFGVIEFGCRPWPSRGTTFRGW